MIVQVKTKHFKKATDFFDQEGCPLFQSLSEILPGKKIWIGGFIVKIDDKKYEMDKVFWVNPNHETGESQGEKTNRLIAQAKAGEETPTFDVEIIGLEI